MKARSLISLLFLAAMAGSATAQTVAPIKLGVLTDMSSVYAEAVGKGSVAAVELAVEDAGGKALGMPIEIVAADFQLKTDVALSITRQWFDRDGVDAIFDVINSGTALAINNLAKEKKKLVFVGAAAADQIGGSECNGYGLGWLYTLTSVVKSVVAAQVARGNDTWFLLLPDAAYGTLMDTIIKRELTAAGGKVLGTVRFPYETQDFSSFLLQAQSSPAKTIVSTSGGTPNINIMKQAREFGLPNAKQNVGGMIDIITDVKAAGLKVMEGQTYGTSFYWNYDDKTRAFSERFFKKMNKMPTNNQAADYSAALHYLRAVNATNSRDPEKITTWLQGQQIEDAVVRNGKLRKGGRLIHDMYLVEAKKPADQKGDWDFYNVVGTVDPEKAFGPASESGCPADK